MAFLKTENVKITGISACVPKGIEENTSYHLFNKEEANSFIAATGVEKRRKVDAGEVITSDLCISAAQNLISALEYQLNTEPLFI